MTRTVAVAGLGAIGLPLARALDGGIDGLQLVAVAARDHTKARANLAGFRDPAALMNFANRADTLVLRFRANRLAAATTSFSVLSVSLVIGGCP